MLMACYESAKDENLRLKEILLYYYIGITFSWFGLLMYKWYPEIFTYINVFLYFSFLAVAVLLYHFIFIVTKLDKTEKFNPFHYLPPAILSASLLVWSFFVPFEVPLSIVKSMGTPVKGYEWFSWYFTLKIPMRFLFGLTYTSLSAHRIWRYRQAKLKGKKEPVSGYSLNWLYILLSISTLLLFMYVMTVAVSKAVAYHSMWIALGIILMLFLQFSLIVSLLHKSHQAIVSIRNEKHILLPQMRNTRKVAKKKAQIVLDEKKTPLLAPELDREIFHRYFLYHKPYLNTNLSLDDLTEPICMSRNKLSRFINENFGMNFNRYVGIWRMYEISTLLADPANKKRTLKELLPKVGIGSYRTYSRVKEEYRQLEINEEEWLNCTFDINNKRQNK